MTHAVDEVSPNVAVMPSTRSLNRHSCAGGSPPAPDCCGAGCVDCHCGNGGVHANEGDGCDGWGIFGCRSKGSATPGEEFFTKTVKSALFAEALN